MPSGVPVLTPFGKLYLQPGELLGQRLPGHLLQRAALAGVERRVGDKWVRVPMHYRVQQGDELRFGAEKRPPSALGVFLSGVLTSLRSARASHRPGSSGK